MDWLDDVVRTRGRACVTAAAVHLVMVAREDPVDASGDRRRARGAGRRAARLGAARARPCGGDAGLRARPHGALLRAVGAHRHDDRTSTAGAPTRRSRSSRPRCSSGSPACGSRAGGRRPSAQLGDAERDEVAERINATGADVVWVGIGQPKQEKWMAEMRDRLRGADPRRRRRRVRLPRGDRAAGAGLDAAARARVVLPPRARAAPALAALREVQPALRRGVRAPVRRPPGGAGLDGRAAAERGEVGLDHLGDHVLERRLGVHPSRSRARDGSPTSVTGSRGRTNSRVDDDAVLDGEPDVAERDVDELADGVRPPVART